MMSGYRLLTRVRKSVPFISGMRWSDRMTHLVFREQFEAVLCALREQDVVAFAAQQASQRAADVRFVDDDEQPALRRIDRRKQQPFAPAQQVGEFVGGHGRTEEVSLHFVAARRRRQLACASVSTPSAMTLI